MPGGFGQRKVFIGVHTCSMDGRRKGCVCVAVASKTKVGPSALSLLCPRRKAPLQVVPQTPHPGPAGNGVLLLLLRAAVERSWEELPAHPSHIDMAFTEYLKQQILPGTYVVVSVKDGLSKIPVTPAMCLLPSGTHRTPLGLAQGLPFPEKGTPKSPWPHCIVPISQPGPCHSWTGVGAIMFECLTRTGTAPTAWLSGARD